MIRRLLLLLALVGLTAPALGADDPRMVAPTGLVLTYSAAPADRPALKAIMRRDGLARLDAMKAKGTIAGYRLLWNRYADNVTWDMMLVLDMATPAGIGAWHAVENSSPGGLPDAAAKLVRRVEVAPIDMLRQRASGKASADPVYLVIPYDYLVSLGEYVRYVDGYVVPQMNGWLEEGVLADYGFLVARYPAGRPWTAMLLLAYRGDAGLGLRDATTAKVRARLASDPAWKTFADNKANIREERAPIVADVLGAR